MQEETGASPVDVQQNTDEIVIDVTHSIDGVPIDLSSPEKNHGVHYEKLVEEAIEEEVKQQEAIHREESMKEALIDQVMQEEDERQYYQQLMAEEALREVQRQQLLYEQENVEFLEEQTRYAERRASKGEGIIDHDGGRTDGDYDTTPIDDCEHVYASPRLVDNCFNNEIEEDADTKSIPEDHHLSSMNHDDLQHVITTNTLASEIDDDDSLEPPPSNKIAPTRPTTNDELVSASTIKDDCEEIPEHIQQKKMSNEDNNNNNQREQSSIHTKEMTSNQVPSVHRVLNRIVSTTTTLSNDRDVPVDVIPPPMRDDERQYLTSQFSVDESSLDSLSSPTRSPPPPVPPTTTTTTTNNNDNNDNNNNNNDLITAAAASLLLGVEQVNNISPDGSLCSSIITQGHDEIIHMNNGCDDDDDDDVNDDVNDGNDGILKPRSLRFNDDQINDENDKEIENDNKTDHNKEEEEQEEEEEEEELNHKEVDDDELPSSSNWPNISHSVAASMAIGGANQSPSTPPKRSKIPRLRKNYKSSIDISKYSLYSSKTSSNQNQIPGIVMDENGKFISSTFPKKNKNVTNINCIQEEAEEDNDNRNRDDFLSAFLVASGVLPVQAIRATAMLRKQSSSSSITASDQDHECSPSIQITPESLRDKTNRMDIAQLLKQAGLKPANIRNIFLNADKVYHDIENESPEISDSPSLAPSPKKINLLKLKMKIKNDSNDMNRTAQAMTPPIPSSSSSSSSNDDNTTAGNGGGVGVKGGNKKGKSFKKPSVDPTEWARKRKEKADKAKEARDSRLFGM